MVASGRSSGARSRKPAASKPKSKTAVAPRQAAPRTTRNEQPVYQPPCPKDMFVYVPWRAPKPAAKVRSDVCQQLGTASVTNLGRWRNEAAFAASKSAVIAMPAWAARRVTFISAALSASLRTCLTTRFTHQRMGPSSSWQHRSSKARSSSQKRHGKRQLRLVCLLRRARLVSQRRRGGNFSCSLASARAAARVSHHCVGHWHQAECLQSELYLGVLLEYSVLHVLAQLWQAQGSGSSF